ncbi:poly(ADP-ribose) glycohydrolase-like isoform X2 [Chrysoperla carnea]|uniref:poly(ADP-ribose) glycohydrolase-like isoform X2 n=1 Tax=Chrysoperla carnea TaxID=189513 RepID=UPI001D09487E|nr:poly(ADP-ribose) glycohydrolase-like isoform X2 [Chrysoperla carnea]
MATCSSMPTADKEGNDQSWRGSTMTEIYNNKGPYDWDPDPIQPTNDHEVLFMLPIPEKGPPKPRFTSESYCWNPDYVRMPFAAKENLYPVSKTDPTVLKNRWTLIKEALSQPIHSSNDLQRAIFVYNNKYEDQWQFYTLHHFFNNVLDEDENEDFFKNLLPNIIKLALQLPELLPSSIPLLKKNKTHTISLTQLQIASLLANAFLCTFPRRETNTFPRRKTQKNKPQSEFDNYSPINFNGVFQSTKRRRDANCNKLKCIFNYFQRVVTNPPDGVVTFQRRYFNESELPQWHTVDQPLSPLRIHIDDKGTIEDGLGLLQVDFADKYIGGGILASGMVQEEIRFAAWPELIVSSLFTEKLEATEAVTITGAEQYNTWTGYGDTFTWTGNYKDTTPRDIFRRRKSYLVAIDATHFYKQPEQYNIPQILREINKAYVGYYSPSQNKPIPAVATGNWGCGVFKGDPYLKSLLQIMACRLAGRNIVYYSFGNTKLRDELYSLFTVLVENNITIGIYSLRKWILVVQIK